MSGTHYATLTEGRNHFKDLLDAAESGRPASVCREGFRGVVLDGERLRHFLSMFLPVSAEMVAEADGWSIFLRGLPLAADGATPTDAVDEMVDALREYAEDWTERLLHAPNHKDNWGLVQFIALSSDDQLRGWLIGR